MRPMILGYRDQKCFRKLVRASLVRVLEAECFWDEDDADPVSWFGMDDQRLGEQAAGVADGLHARELPGEAVLADAAQAFVDVSDELLVTDDEDDVAARIGIGPELTPRTGADEDLAVVGDRVRAADDVVGGCAELRISRPCVSRSSACSLDRSES
jgi:hypothetical protein